MSRSLRRLCDVSDNIEAAVESSLKLETELKEAESLIRQLEKIDDPALRSELRSETRYQIHKIRGQMARDEDYYNQLLNSRTLLVQELSGRNLIQVGTLKDVQILSRLVPNFDGMLRLKDEGQTDAELDGLYGQITEDYHYQCEWWPGALD